MGAPRAFFLRVALRGEDLAAISALEALRDEMGASDLAALSRETVWEIAIEDAGADARLAASSSARERLAAIARESLLFANPVKEHWALEEGALRIASPSPGRRRIGLLVTDRSELAGPACARALASAHDLAGATVRRATLWLLDLPDVGRDATAARARALGVATRRERGLLANPHSQDVEILLD